MSLAILERGLWQPVLRHVHGESVSKHALLGKMAKAFGKSISIVPSAPAQAHDMRLATRYPDFLEGLDIQPLDAQLAEVKRHSDTKGHWLAKNPLERTA